MPQQYTIKKVQSNFNNAFGKDQWQHKKYVLAVSGGPDSMALLGICQALGISFVVAHINYKQRADASDDEEKMLVDYCKSNGIICTVKTWNLGKNMPSFQEEARKFRYKFFNEIAENTAANFILTAHHLQDRAETLIYNLSRGAGLAGMSSIPTLNKNIFRPLLNCTKPELLEFLELNKIPFAVDASNLEDKYVRNAIRLNILPELQKVHPSAITNLVQSAQIAENAHKELNYFYARVWQANALLINTTPNVKALSIYELKEEVTDLKGFFNFLLTEEYQIKNNYSQAEALALQAEKESEESKIFEFGEICIEFFKERLYVWNNTHFQGFNIQMPSLEALVNFLKSQEIDSEISHQKEEIKPGKHYVDCSKIVFPLSVRQLKEGDKIKALGMHGKNKAINKLLQEWNYALWQKKRCQLCVDANGDVLFCDWKRQSELTKVDFGTEKTLIIATNLPN